MKKRHEFIIDCLHLPKDVICGMETVMLTGNSEMLIRNFRDICYYDDELISLSTTSYMIKIIGCGLWIEYFTKEEIKIRGKICSVNYEGSF